MLLTKTTHFFLAEKLASYLEDRAAVEQSVSFHLNGKHKPRSARRITVQNLQKRWHVHVSCDTFPLSCRCKRIVYPSEQVNTRHCNTCTRASSSRRSREGVLLCVATAGSSKASLLRATEMKCRCWPTVGTSSAATWNLILSHLLLVAASTKPFSH